MREIVSVNNVDEYIAAVGATIVERLKLALNVRPEAHLVLTGGTMGIAVLRGIPLDAIDWSRVHLWWGDERFVATTSMERNCVQAWDVLLEALQARQAHIHRMPASDVGLTLDDAAIAYASELAAHATDGAAYPIFDVTLLGMGPDAHVASLFPDHADAKVAGSVCAVRNSPKPPPERLSLTYEAINSSREVWLLVKDAAKGPALASVLAADGNYSLPASAVHGREKTLVWTDDATLGATV